MTAPDEGVPRPCCASTPHDRTEPNATFDLHPVADGVYAAIAAHHYKQNSNAAVILTDDGVVVVDTHSKPSAARALRAAIRELTPQPVRVVVNTHDHWDHWQGNQVYVEEDGAEVIASAVAARRLVGDHDGIGGLAFLRRQLRDVPREVVMLETAHAQERDPTRATHLATNLAQARAYLEELRALRPALPSRRLARTTRLDIGGRRIDLLLLGRGHTAGDVHVHLPDERVVATGDALIGWMPYMDDGYPLEWLAVLTALDQLAFEHIVPGHGDVLPREHLAFFRGYLADLVAEVVAAADDGATVAEMQATIPGLLAPRYRAGMSRHERGQFDERVEANVAATARRLGLDARGVSGG